MSWVSERVAFGAALLIVGLLLAACGEDGVPSEDVAGESPSGQHVAVPTSEWRSGDAGGRARVTGRLDMSDPACPVVIGGTGGDETLVMWPAGTYAAEEDATHGLYSEDGTLLARDGDDLALTGSTTTDVDSECRAAQGEAFVVEGEVTVVEN